MADLRPSDGLRKTRRLSAAQRAMVFGEAMPWLDPADRQRAAAWLVLQAERGNRPAAGVAAALHRLARIAWGGDAAAPADEAVYQLTRCWPSVPQALKPIALSIGPRARWTRAIERAAASADPAARASIAEIAATIATPGAMDLVLGLLCDDVRGVQVAAERAIVRATGRAGLLAAGGDADEDASAGPTPDDEPVEGIEGVLAQAIAEFDQHRRFGVLLAAVATLSDASASAARRGVGHALAAWFAGDSTPAHGALRMVLRKADIALARERALSWIVLDPVASAAGDRLARARTPAEHDAVLARVHLIRRAERRSKLGYLRDRPKLHKPKAAGPADAGLDPAETPPATIRWPEACPVPDEAMTEALSPAGRAGLAEWLAGIGLDSPTRTHILMRRLVDPEPRVRYSVVRFGTTTLREDLVYDPSGAVSRSAALSLSRVGEPMEASPEPWMRGLGRHADASLRAMGTQERARHDADAATAAGTCAARRQASAGTLDPASRIAERIHYALDPSDRISAMRLAVRLGLCEAREIREAMLEVLRLGDAARQREGDASRVVATAVRALTAVPGDAVVTALHAALHAEHPRVRANAIEALAERRRKGMRVDPADISLIEFTGDAHQRVRANAVRAALFAGHRPASKLEAKPTPPNTPERPHDHERAGETLRSMLGDERPAHRVSALWVAGRALRRGPEIALGTRWTELAAVIADMARHDPDGAARARAAACMGSLEAEARQRWRRGSGRSSDDSAFDIPVDELRAVAAEARVLPGGQVEQDTPAGRSRGKGAVA